MQENVQERFKRFWQIGLWTTGTASLRKALLGTSFANSQACAKGPQLRDHSVVGFFQQLHAV
eukprot:2261151-Alexandrium_andersonii.AAC.1